MICTIVHLICMHIVAILFYCDGPQSSTRLEKAPGSPAHYFARSVKEGQGGISIVTMDPSTGQIAVEEGRDGLAGLRDLVVVVVLIWHPAACSLPLLLYFLHSLSYFF